MKKLLHTAAVFAALLSAPAWAQTPAVKVEGAWARASVQGQKATGAFMRLTAKDGARLVRAESPAAGLAEVHEEPAGIADAGNRVHFLPAKGLQGLAIAGVGHAVRNIAFQLQDLFPAGPPLAFSFEDPVPGDCDPFVDCNDGRASLGSFSTFTGVGTLTADGSIGVDTVLNAPSIVVHRAQLRSVPEPSSMALLTIGAAMAARRRYRNGTGSAASPRIAVRRPPRSVLRTHPIV